MTDAASSPAGTSPTRPQWLMLVGILLVATFLRFLWIGAGEADFDELWFLELSTGRGSAHETLPMNALLPRVQQLTSLDEAPPWYRIPASLGETAHPPLDFLVLRAWRTAFGRFGDSITIGRSMSAVLSVLCVLALFDVVRQIYPVSIALWSALILALSSSQIELAQDIRNYSLLILFALCAAGAILRIEKAGVNRAHATVLGISLLGAVFTHYFFAPAAAAMAVYALIRLRGTSRWTIVGAIVGAYVIFAIVWSPMFTSQLRAIREASTPGAPLETAPDHVARTINRLAANPVSQLFRPRPVTGVAALLSATLFVIPWLVLKTQPKLLLWILWLTFTAGFIAALDFSRSTLHLEQIRHTILAGPAVCAMLAALMVGQRPMLTHGLPALVCLACIAALGLTYDRNNKPFSALAGYLAPAQANDSPLIFDSDHDQKFWGQWLLLASSHYTGLFPRGVARLDRPADPQLLEQLHRWPTLWLTSGATSLAPEKILPGCRAAVVFDRQGSATIWRIEWIDPPNVQNAGP